MIAPEGVVTVSVKMNKQRAKLPLYVIKGSSPPLFGREWLREIQIDWREIKTVRVETIERVLQRHNEVFKKELGTLKGIVAAIALKPHHQPWFCQARNVPYALRPKVEDLLKPNVASIVEKAQKAQCARQRMHAKARTFQVGNKVLLRDYGRGEKWSSGVVSAETGPVLYTVDVGSSMHWRRHADQMLTRDAELEVPRERETVSSHVPKDLPVFENTVPEPSNLPPPDPVGVQSSHGTPEVTNTPPPETGKRYPSRVGKEPFSFCP
ncbi:hypothetical protein NHX12_005705 [Muraenolepis orangiensis]|uniref:Uncharacterized protein n=1 Tax=Muraenolepis orangiensis TaxID=630683 RepID=A0A9Q0DR54_9TELE|nr:hypothetical protein NHX12_005705 [Muraenolepis orangiensis]